MRRISRTSATGIILAILVLLTGIQYRSGSSPPARAAEAPIARPLDAYRGLGTWVDIYNTRPYNRPRVAIRKMARKNVRTLFLQTGNYHSPNPIHRPRSVSTLIEAAHGKGIRVVAWYLPSYARLERDYRRSIAAIRFQTEHGQRFDSFALDIEATIVRDISTRNDRARRLAARLRGAVGSSYPMGAIVPEAHALYWPDFPYDAMARRFDVFLPMAYFTFRTSSFHGVYRWVTDNIRAIRTATNLTIPIHVIGGLAGDASLRETAAYVKSVVDQKTLGGSLYHFPSTRAEQWHRLQEVPAP
jgi:hypothetical protein